MNRYKLSKGTFQIHWHTRIADDIICLWYWDGVCFIGRNTITWNKWIQNENIRADFYHQDSLTLKWDLIMNIRDGVWLHTGTCNAINALSNKQDSHFMSYWTLFGEKLKSDYVTSRDLIFLYRVKLEVLRSESFYPDHWVIMLWELFWHM